MSLLSGNSCNIITLLPLGVYCYSINAATPTSTNGYISLSVTGGTPPYSVKWSNGQNGMIATSLKPGDYTAQIVDYYGDFSATTTCSVGYDSFYLEKFEDCSKSGSYIYYLADLVNKDFTPGKIYHLTTQTGCWISSGTTLYTNQSYVNSYADIYAGPFTSCTQCLPTPTPAPVYPQNLCVTYTTRNLETLSVTNTQKTFSSGATINGYPSWTASSPSYLIYYNTGTTRWLISGWTNPVPYYQNPTAPPTGTWVVPGNMSIRTDFIVTSGVCVNPPLALTYSKTNPSCSNVSDGSVTINGSGGLPPYTYSIGGVNYQTSSTFLSLAPGSYTLYIKDSVNSVTSTAVSVTSQQSFQQYVATLTLTQGSIVSVGTTKTRTSNWNINISPSLPTGVVVNLKLFFNITYNKQTFDTSSPTLTNTITTSATAGSTISLIGVSTPTTTSTMRPDCSYGDIKTSAFTQSYNVQVSGTGLVSGTLVQSVNTQCIAYTYRDDQKCQLYGSVSDTVGLGNISITPSACKSINQSITPIQVTLSSTGDICAN